MRINHLTYVFLGILAVSSCISPKKHLSDEKYENKALLYKQKIEGNKNFSDYELSQYYQQQTNRHLFVKPLMPYLRAYLLGIKSFDPEKVKMKRSTVDSSYKAQIDALSELDKRKKEKKTNKLIRKRNKKVAKLNTVIQEGNWLMRTVGEPPSLYDSTVTNTTVDQLRLFYQSNGYFHADVSQVTTITKRKARITYQVTPSLPYKLNRITYSCEDPKIKRILKTFAKDSELVKGDNYTVKHLTQERERINTLLKDNGYFHFHRQYVFLKVDTTVGRRRVNIEVDVQLPIEKEVSQTYQLRNVYFILNRNEEGEQDTIHYNGLDHVSNGNIKYSKKTLDYHIKVKPEYYYHYSNSLKTQNLLGNINAFKFININYKEVGDSSNPALDAFIYANTFEKYALTSEVGVNVNVNQVQRLPGPFLNFKFTNRRVFKGFEVFEVNARYAVQGQVSFTAPDQIFPSQEIGLNSSLSFPIFLFQDILFPDKYKLKFSNYTPKTTLSLGLSDITRVEYRRTAVNFLMSYSWQKKRNAFFNFSPADLNIIDTRNVTEDFQNYLSSLRASNGVDVRQSFIPSFVSSIHGSYTYNNNDLTKNQKSKFLRLFVESGGTAITIANAFEGKQQNAEIFELPYYQFYKLNADGRYYLPVSRTGTIAMRMNIGVAQGFGAYSTLPYEKFFFVGGINSIRAWNPRRLGPGSFIQTNDGVQSFRFEQPGEILMESSIELRSELFSVFHGAFFVDFGNIWTIQEDPNRPGAEWRPSTFLSEIAFGSGVGLRLDFSYIIMRFDMGVKVWDPATQSVVPWSSPLSRVFNIGLGYPF